MPYALGGSLASSLIGEPRSTVDVDIAIKLDDEAGAALLERANAEFYVPIDSARAAIRAHSSFNLIDTTHGLKVDLFVLGEGLLDRMQIARRIRITIPGVAGEIWVTSEAVEAAYGVEHEHGCLLLPSAKMPLMGRLDGKVALISGAARGQGAAEARLFVAEGAQVMLGDVLDGDGEFVAKKLGDRAAYCHHNVTQEADWAAIVEATRSRFGRLDVLVNNAGVFKVVGMTATTLEEYMRIVTINQIGTFLGMQAVADPMIAQRSGSIINISSVAGLVGGAGTIAYTASKFAVRGMTKVAAVELAPFGVRVNSVHPGLIDTPMLHEAFGANSDATMEALGGRVPNGRMATADDVARLVLYLASDDSSYSTGSEFVVDGGMTARLG